MAEGMDGENGGVADEESKELWVKDIERWCSRG